MKRLFSLLACLAVVLSLSIPAFATEVTDTTEPVEVVEPSETSPAYSVSELDELEFTGPSGSIPEVLTTLFGEYTPRTQTVTEYLADGSEVTYQQVIPGLAGLDWLWLASVGIFTLGLYCVFRAIGGSLKWI